MTGAEVIALKKRVMPYMPTRRRLLACERMEGAMVLSSNQHLRVVSRKRLSQRYQTELDGEEKAVDRSRTGANLGGLQMPRLVTMPLARLLTSHALRMNRQTHYWRRRRCWRICRGKLV